MSSIVSLRNELSDISKQEHELFTKYENVKSQLISAFDKFCEKALPEGCSDCVNIRGEGILNGWRLREGAKVFITMNSIGIIEFYPKKLWNTEVNYKHLDELISKGVSVNEVDELKRIFKEVA